MPLTRGKAIGYDADLMAFKFTMRSGQQIVPCQISTAALSDLADRRRGSEGDLLAEFKANRALTASPSWRGTSACSAFRVRRRRRGQAVAALKWT
jgi:hypothetical protein